ncbi:hypothetical protein G7Y89_g6740 [Cudoniella acicularis]|uniref:ABC transporter domain-containing protein n=1 Tax=Cudoniella acicularis TaxID=354080 RepID=A0A8H4W2K3_9HELO|nr:hypothetical protein G7Y89_g6740 [Cudoniella acicularis]
MSVTVGRKPKIACPHAGNLASPASRPKHAATLLCQVAHDAPTKVFRVPVDELVPVIQEESVPSHNDSLEQTASDSSLGHISAGRGNSPYDLTPFSVGNLLQSNPGSGNAEGIELPHEMLDIFSSEPLSWNYTSDAFLLPQIQHFKDRVVLGSYYVVNLSPSFVPLDMKTILKKRDLKAGPYGSALSRAYCMSKLRSYPEMLCPNDGTLPPFIHPQSRPSPRKAVLTFIWRTIQAESQRIEDEYLCYDTWTTLASIQAMTIYIILGLLRDNSECVAEEDILIPILSTTKVSIISFETIKNSKTLMFLPQRMAEKYQPTGWMCNGEVQQDQIPTWEEWALAESRRRTAIILVIIIHIFNIEHGQGLPQCGGFADLSLPCSKALWQASEQETWEREYRKQYMRDSSSSGSLKRILTYRDLLPDIQDQDDPTSASKTWRLSEWFLASLSLPQNPERTPTVQDIFYAALCIILKKRLKKKRALAPHPYAMGLPSQWKLDIEGLHITVTSGSGKSALKGKGKARAEGLEILANASLKLKAGVHYALIGRNGTGKSTLLKAVAQKLIPGIPLQTRISILQQTSSDDSSSPSETATAAKSESISTSQLSVLEYVIDKATARNEIQHEIDVLLKAIDSPDSTLAPLRALRQIQHERLKRELFELDKDARLRSGTRGMAARKALTAFEKKVAESAERLGQKDEEIDQDTVQEETHAASDLLAELQSQIEPARLADIESKALSILSGLGFPKANLGKAVSTLSGGWRMRTNLASVLLQPSDILILDEPTNFLDLLGIIWLQRFLIQLSDSGPNPPTVVLVSHDRDFINAVCQELVILRDQELTYFKGDLISYEASVRDKKLYLGRMRDAQEKQKAHIQQTIQQNIKQGKAAGDENKLRQAKSRQKKLDNRMGMEKSATGGRFKLNRDLAGYHLTARAEIDVPADERGVSITLPDAPDLRFPGPLVSLEKVTFKYPTSKKSATPAPIVLQEIDLTIHMGDRIGVVGLNGCGKSTLIKLITDTTKPTKGAVTRHPRLRMGYYSQHAVEELQSLGYATLELTALSLLTKDVEGELDEGELRGLLGSLGLPGRTASDVPLTKLSGGQLVRLALARLLWKCPQLLVLDEITTHLDFHTVTALADALSTWNGAVLIVSHDRFLIRRVVQGEKDRDGDEDAEESEDEEVEETRRRLVFLLKSGALKALERGVGQFEESLEKRVEKLLNS